MQALAHQQREFASSCSNFEQEARFVSTSEMNQQEQILNRNFEIAISNLRHTEQAHFESRRDALIQEAERAIQSERKPFWNMQKDI